MIKQFPFHLSLLESYCYLYGGLKTTFCPQIGWVSQHFFTLHDDDDCLYYLKISSSVPLIEILRSSNSSSRFYIFCFAVSKEKIYYRKKAVGPDLISPPSIYMRMCSFLHIYEYTYAEN